MDAGFTHSQIIVFTYNKSYFEPHILPLSLIVSIGLRHFTNDAPIRPISGN